MVLHGKVQEMLSRNYRWARRLKKQNANYFKEMALGQNPSILWIGCSDSRVPAETLSGYNPGDLFVHRNVANMVIHTDINCLSVVQYAVEVLGVKDIIICGHTNCGGINAAMGELPDGLISNWLMHIQDVYIRNKEFLDTLSPAHKGDVLTRLNVAQQIYNLGRCNIIRSAWERGQDLTIHGLVYNIGDGHLLDEEVYAYDSESLEANYKSYLEKQLHITDTDLDNEAMRREAEDKAADLILHQDDY